MKRFFTISFIALALVVGAAGAAPAAHATPETVQACVDNGGTQTQCQCEDAGGVWNSTDENCSNGNGGTIDPTAARAVTGGLTDPSGGDKFGVIMTWIMSLFAWLVGVAALTLNYAVYYTVVTMGNYVNNLSAVGVTWQIMRDIGNIIFIFGFLAIGICTILDVKWYGGGMKMLPMLLVGAVFLNFSLFFTEAIIDTGNLFATQFFTQINGGTMPTGTSLSGITVGTFGSGTAGNEAISNAIMGKLGFQTIYNAGKVNSEVFKAGYTWVVGFMGIILFLVTAFVMFSLAFVLIARFVILLFLIIVAPIGFAGLAIPNLGGLATKWWNKLVEQTITAPILLLCLYIALRIITDVNFLTFGSTGNWTGFIPNPSGGTDYSGFGSVVISFLVAMGLLLAVVIISKSLSAFGADKASKLAGMVSFGAVSLGGRATLGMLGAGLANKRMQSWARNSNSSILGRYSARGLAAVGKGLRTSAFDVRNVPGVTTGLGMIGVDAGKGATFTAKQAYEAKFGVKPVKEFFKRGTDEREAAGRELDFKDALKRAQDPSTPNRDELAESTLSRMGNKEIEELDGIKKGVEVLVRNLSPEQFENLMKSDKFTETEKEKMRGGRYNSLHAAITAGDKSAVRQWSAKDLATAMPDILKNPTQAAKLVNLISDSQFDAVVKNDKLTKGQQQQLRDYSTPGTLLNYLDIANGRPLHAPALVTAGIIPAGTTPAAATAAAVPLMSTMSPKKFAKLRSEILTDPLAIALLTPKHLAAIMTDGDLDPPQIHTIAGAVRNVAHPNHAAIMTYLNPATNPIAASYWA